MTPCRRRRVLVTIGALVVSAALSGSARQPDSSQLTPSREQLAQASPELLELIGSDSFAYFRFINRPWSSLVCERFRDELTSLSTVRLHGDAHIEQYSFTNDARGLDDFDDSALGPSVIDIVRFLGSLDLLVRRRGWVADRDVLFGAFFDGYRRGLERPDYLPAEPAVVTRLRRQPGRDQRAFLAWADSLMVPLTNDEAAAVDKGTGRFREFMSVARADLPKDFLSVKAKGRLRLGIGSALTAKLLIRVEGPTASPDDDVVIEAKQLSDLRDIACLTVPAQREAFRVVEGTEQIGRLRHEILSIVPGPFSAQPDVNHWWIRSWEWSYREVDVDAYQSVVELADVARDVGAQLGSTNVRDTNRATEAQQRVRERDALARLEPRIRTTVVDLVDEVMQAWEGFRKGVRPQG